jgi:hypothetical protein
MLIATLLSALALNAPAARPWACDLAPSIGQGTSDEGRVDSMTTLNFGCRYEMINILGVGISPVIGLDKQLWSVYQKSSSNKNITSYETQDFNFGIRLESASLWGSRIFYGLSSGQGKGTMNLTQSTDQSSLSSSSVLKNSYWQQSLGTSYGLTEKLSLSLAWQHQSARQTWVNDADQVLLQNVDSDNHLTLSAGQTALVGSSLRSSSKNTTNLIQFGISLQFGN